MKTTTLEDHENSTDHGESRHGQVYWTAALRQSELRYRRLFETAQDGILILDADSGEIVDVNPFLIDLLDYPFEELCGRKLWDIGEFKDIAANQAAFETLQRHEYIRYENLPLRRRDGKQIQVEFVSNVYWVEADKVIQCNIRDITDRAAKEIHSDRQLAALELAASDKREWLVSHLKALRIPLDAMAAMLGLVELGQKLAQVRPLHENPSEFDEAAFQHIRRNFQRLVNSFNELSDLAGPGWDQTSGGAPRDPAAISPSTSINSTNGKS